MKIIIILLILVLSGLLLFIGYQWGQDWHDWPGFADSITMEEAIEGIEYSRFTHQFYADKGILWEYHLSIVDKYTKILDAMERCRDR